MLEEVKTYLMEQTEMILFDNFRFYYQNEVICNFITIGELGIPNNSLIKVKIDTFNMKSI